MMDDRLDSPGPRKARRLRFGTRSLLALVALAALPARIAGDIADYRDEQRGLAGLSGIAGSFAVEGPFSLFLCTSPNMGRVKVQGRYPDWLLRPTRNAGWPVYDRATSLTLSGPKYDDTAVEYITKLRDLRKLELHGTSLTPDGVARLRRSLPHCRIEQHAS